MSTLINKFQSDDVNRRTAVVLLLISIAVIAGGAAYLGWQTYQLGLFGEQVFQHMVTPGR